MTFKCDRGDIKMSEVQHHDVTSPTSKCQTNTKTSTKTTTKTTPPRESEGEDNSKTIHINKENLPSDSVRNVFLKIGKE